MRTTEAAEYKKLYDTQRWRRRSSLQLKQHPLCAMCLEIGQVIPATVAHHIVPHKGDHQLFFFGELMSLCVQCHSGPVQEAEKRGHTNTIGLDGFPVDARHPFNLKE